jgi:hypothetical protein
MIAAKISKFSFNAPDAEAHRFEDAGYVLERRILITNFKNCCKAGTEILTVLMLMVCYLMAE